MSSASERRELAFGVCRSTERDCAPVHTPSVGGSPRILERSRPADPPRGSVEIARPSPAADGKEGKAAHSGGSTTRPPAPRRRTRTPDQTSSALTTKEKPVLRPAGSLIVFNEFALTLPSRLNPRTSPRIRSCRNPAGTTHH